jgi:6-phosphogluconolactonase
MDQQKEYPQGSDVVIAGSGDFAATAARIIAEAAAASLRGRGRCHLALAGGSTPAPIYRALSESPLIQPRDWERINIWFIDERMVPPDHPRSNFGMVQRELLSRVEIPSPNIHRIKGETSPASAAAQYTVELNKYTEGGNIQFDVVVLGTGTDGHIASLFPEIIDGIGGTPPAQAVYVPSLKENRVTVTLEVLNGSKFCIFCISGKSKAEIVAELLGAGRGLPLLPAARIAPDDGEVVWVIDEDAAALIKRP